MRRILQFAPLAIGLVILLIGLLFGLTDWAWRLSGSPSEDYPELFFLGMVAPAGLLLTACGGLWARVFGRRATRRALRPNASAG